MRIGLVIIGIVLLLLGAVLMFVPVLKSDANSTAISYSQCGSSPTCTVSYNIYDASPGVIGGTSAKLTWTSPSNVLFFAVTCTNAVTSAQLQSVATPAQLSKDCGTNATVANQTGTSGTSSFTIPSGGSLVYFAISLNNQEPVVNSSLTTTSPLLGFVLLVVGILLLILGAALKSKKQKQAAAGQVAPSATPPGQPGYPPQ
jgi:uncharacterized membrane protein